MGNFITCTLTPTNSGPTTNIILPNGDIRRVTGSHLPTAADLMLDFPGHFLVTSSSLHVGRRFHPLAADETLEWGHAYVMFPMARVSSTVGDADRGRVVVAGGRKAVRKSRVLPAAAPEPQPEKVQMMKLDDVDAELAGEVRGRLSACRSRRPALETIMEETVGTNYLR